MFDNSIPTTAIRTAEWQFSDAARSGGVAQVCEIVNQSSGVSKKRIASSVIRHDLHRRFPVKRTV